MFNTYYIFYFLLLIVLIYYNKITTLNTHSWIWITTSSNNHFQVLLNLIFSFFLTHPNDLLIYYDLSLSVSNILCKNLKGLIAGVEINDTLKNEIAIAR